METAQQRHAEIQPIVLVPETVIEVEACAHGTGDPRHPRLAKPEPHFFASISQRALRRLVPIGTRVSVARRILAGLSRVRLVRGALLRVGRSGLPVDRIYPDSRPRRDGLRTRITDGPRRLPGGCGSRGDGCRGRAHQGRHHEASHLPPRCPGRVRAPTRGAYRGWNDADWQRRNRRRLLGSTRTEASSIDRVVRRGAPPGSDSANRDMIEATRSRRRQRPG